MRWYHRLAADLLMRRMERCRDQIARDSTMWAHHYEQAIRPRMARKSRAMAIPIAIISACAEVLKNK
jgi:hypothetical protein